MQRRRQFASGWMAGLLCGVCLFAVTAPATGRDDLFRDARVCDAGGSFCIRGTLTYEPNPRLLRLRARVQTAPGAGLLRMTLSGKNRLGQRRYAPFEVRVRGRRSEIIDHKMVPDYPDTLSWAVERVEFVADDLTAD